MPQRPLYRRHDPAARTRHADLKQLALGQERVLRGTPGTLKQRTQSGNRYWVREYIRADGKKVDEYLGAADEATVEAMREAVELARALAAGSAQLRLHGYQRIDRRPAVVLEVLFNRGLVEAGLVLVGSHAYGALLNELGVIAPGYRTQDIDLARTKPLKLTAKDATTLAQLLADTGFEFKPVPGMPSHRPSSSYKLRGAEGLAVDLLAPGARTGSLVAVQELGAHAQAIPFLEFLAQDPIRGVVLSPNQVIPVNLPAPERFAIHKLYASQSRGSQRDKAGKDLEQATVLAAAIEEEAPGALAKAFRDLPAAARSAVARGARAAANLLAGVHEEAAAALRGIA